MYNQIGYELRISRIMNPISGKAIIVAVDHGLIIGPISGISPIENAVKKIAYASPDAIQLSPGSVSAAFKVFKGKNRPALILRIDTANIWRKGLPGENENIFHTGIISPLEALKIGVDAVICFFFVGHNDAILEGEMMQHLSECSYRCREIGLPLIVEAVPIRVENEYEHKLVRLAVRVASEAGADIIKTNYTGDIDSFKDVLQHASVPVLVRGGPKTKSVEDSFKMVEEVMKVGANGIVFGRNILQSENPSKMIQALSKIVHEGEKAKEAMKYLM